MDKLTEEFKNSLICNIENGLENYLELSIDRFIDDGILKDIPIVSSIANGLKIAKNIYDRNLLKQTLTFINEFNKGDLNKDRYIAYKSTIENNPKKCEEELGRILILLNSFIDREKSIILAKLFKSYINKEIIWDELCEYSEITNRIFIQDIEILRKFYIDNSVTEEFDNKYKLDRIAAIGLIKLCSKSKFSFGETILDDFIIVKTDIGEKFTNIVLN